MSALQKFKTFFSKNVLLCLTVPMVVFSLLVPQPFVWMGQNISIDLSGIPFLKENFPSFGFVNMLLCVIMFGMGISKSGELLDLAVKLNIIQKSGAWFSYGDIRLGQGRDNTKLYLEEHPDFASDIEAQVRAHASELFAGRAGKRRGGSLDNAPARAAAEKPAAPAPAPQVQEAPKTRAEKPSIDIMMEDE